MVLFHKILIHHCVLVLVPIGLSFSCANSESTVTENMTIVEPKDTVEIKENDTIPVKKPKTFLALGDSYTIGESVVTAGTWVQQLTDKVNEQADATLGVPKIIARTGWTTGELLGAIASDEGLKSPYDLVSLLIGVNNQYRSYSGDDSYTMDLYKLEFTQLINKAMTLAGGEASHVMVLSIPDYAVTPFVAENDKETVSNEIDMYNKAANTICQSKNVIFIDINPISKQAKDDLSLIASDRLHPSEKMYELWAQKVFNTFDFDRL